MCPPLFYYLSIYPDTSPLQSLSQWPCLQSGNQIKLVLYLWLPIANKSNDVQTNPTLSALYIQHWDMHSSPPQGNTGGLSGRTSRNSVMSLLNPRGKYTLKSHKNRPLRSLNQNGEWKRNEPKPTKLQPNLSPPIYHPNVVLPKILLNNVMP